MTFTLYTDGSSIGNPGPGGWAFLVLLDEKIIHQNTGGEGFSTNNRMELTAVIQALLYCREYSIQDPVICTDSMYVYDGITRYLAQWVKRGRKLSNKKPVQNKDLWMIVDKILPQIPGLVVQWVKAHAINQYNNVIDELARNSALAMPIHHTGVITYLPDIENTSQQSLFS